MCNAWNHPPGCTCGWGGIGHAGRSPGGWHNTGGYHASLNYLCFTTNGYRWRYFEDDFCRPTTCPICGADVFFVRHNGGSVWFDALGKPWPKHACFDTSYSSNRYYYHSVEYGWNSTYGVHERLLFHSGNLTSPVLAIVVEGILLIESDDIRIALRCEDGQFLTIYVPAQTSVRNLIGEMVLFSRLDKKVVFISLGRDYSLQLEPPPPFVVGELYVHENYGAGELISVKRVGDDFGIEAMFHNGGYRKMLISATGLKPLKKRDRSKWLF